MKKSPLSNILDITFKFSYLKLFCLTYLLTCLKSMTSLNLDCVATARGLTQWGAVLISTLHLFSRSFVILSVTNAWFSSLDLLFFAKNGGGVEINGSLYPFFTMSTINGGECNYFSQNSTWSWIFPATDFDCFSCSSQYLDFMSRLNELWIKGCCSFCFFFYLDIVLTR